MDKYPKLQAILIALSGTAATVVPSYLPMMPGHDTLFIAVGIIFTMLGATMFANAWVKS